MHLLSTHKPKLYGIIPYERTKNIIKRQPSLLEAALYIPFDTRIFRTYSTELEFLKKNPNGLTIVYAGRFLAPTMHKMKDWEKILTVNYIDPETAKLTKSYTTWLVTSINSEIFTINDLCT